MDKNIARVNNRYLKETYGCENDAARSMSVCYATKGIKITVFDHGARQKVDDWTTIEVEDSFSGCQTIGTFEKTQNVGDVAVQYNRKTGNLDGRISSFEYEVGTILFLVLELI